MDTNNGSFLRSMLQCAVPLHMVEIASWSFEDRQAAARECEAIIAHEGENTLFKSKKPGGTARGFNALARAIAILAYQPGGVTTFGDHYEAPFPPVQKKAARWMLEEE